MSPLDVMEWGFATLLWSAVFGVSVFIVVFVRVVMLVREAFKK